MNWRNFFLALAIGLTLLGGLPQTDFYPQLAQGDHGRDLYATQEVLRGKLPYKDFWWVYGPLMPYYYAIFYKLTGGTIASFLIGKLLLKVACAAFFYMAAAVFMAPFVAFLAAMWFSEGQQDFFFTFNHIGGLVMGLWILYLLFSYIKKPRLSVLWATLPLTFIYCMVKVNFGLASVVGTGMAVALCDYVRKHPPTQEKKKFYLSLLLGIPAATAIVYWLLLKDLPSYALHQCMPYFGDDQPYHVHVWVTVPYYFMQHWLTFMHSPFNMGIGLLLHSATLIVLVLLLTGRLKAEERQNLLLCLAVLGIFFVLNFHEFIVSGVWYRTYWSLPFLFMFHFIMMSTGYKILPKWGRGLIWSIFSAMILLGLLAEFFGTQQQKIPPRYLSGPHAKVYVGNELEWTATVNAVGNFLNQNLKEGETFFALPYDCIYYYLADKESPTRQLIFFDHIHIPPQQEVAIIKELEQHNVKYVLLSNRIASSETGLGIFGKTYCPLIARYIADNYTPFVRQGGNWQAEPGWGNNHGVLIFKKK